MGGTKKRLQIDKSYWVLKWLSNTKKVIILYNTILYNNSICMEFSFNNNGMVESVIKDLKSLSLFYFINYLSFSRHTQNSSS